VVGGFGGGGKEVVKGFLGPLALQCVPAVGALAAFLHYLTVDDTAYE
jgi:hypothetical protein